MEYLPFAEIGNVYSQHKMVLVKEIISESLQIFQLVRGLQFRCEFKMF